MNTKQADKLAHQNVKRISDVEWCRMFNFDAETYTGDKITGVDKPLLFNFRAIEKGKITDLRNDEQAKRVEAMRAALEVFEQPRKGGGFDHPDLEENDTDTTSLIEAPLYR